MVNGEVFTLAVEGNDMLCLSSRTKLLPGWVNDVLSDVNEATCTSLLSMQGSVGSLAWVGLCGVSETQEVGRDTSEENMTKASLLK